MRAAIAGARRRPRALRGADHAPRPHRRRRRAGADVEAQRRLRLARRAARRHRRRRDPLVHALAQPRHDGRPRPRAGPPPVERQPRLLRPVRARPDRQHPAQGRRRAEGGRGGRSRAGRRPGGAGRGRWSRPSGRWSSACSSSPTRCARRRRAPRPAPDLRLLDRGRRRLPRLLPRLPGGRRRGRGVEASRLASAWRRSGRSPPRSGCSGSPRPSGCRQAAWSGRL